MSSDSGYHSWDVLFYALGQKQSLLCDNDMYRQALAMRPDMEEALQGLVTSKDTPEGCSDMRRAEMDVLFSCIAYTLGDKAEATASTAAWKPTHTLLRPTASTSASHV